MISGQFLSVRRLALGFEWLFAGPVRHTAKHTQLSHKCGA